jgi:hypothetical protein
MATRVRLFSGCWAVSDTPAVWVWKRIQVERSFSAPKRWVISLYQIRRAARNLAISSKKSLWLLKKNDSRGANSSNPQATTQRLLDVGDPVGDGEGQLLDRRRAGLADVVAADADRVPARQLARAPLDRVDEPAIDGAGGKMYSFWAMNSLRMSFWSVPASNGRGTPRFSAAAMYIAQIIAAGELIVIEVLISPTGRPSSSTSMSARARDRHAAGAELAGGHRVVGS